MNRSFNLKRWSLVSIATLSMFFSCLVSAEAGTPDARVKAALTKAGIKYEITTDGDFKITMKFDDDRTQVVLINSNTETLKDTNIEIREISAIAYKTTGNIPADVANVLMKDSQKRKIGAWELISTTSGTSAAIFDAKIPADISGDNLVKVVQLVAIRADVMEKELTSKDDF